MQPKILLEDELFLVVDKPAGLVVNRADSVKETTVQDWAEGYLKIRSTKHESRNKSKAQNSNGDKSFGFRNSDFEFSSRAGIVHRIDKETSGCLIIAKTPEAFVELQRQFKAREVEKTYIALVHGKFEREQGIINAAVGRLPWNRERFGILSGGREAETIYKVTKLFEKPNKQQKEYYSLVEFRPKTGRTHQIRVHAKYLHHALVSDVFYAGRKTSRKDREWCPRLFLHAAKISFTHPVTKERVTVESSLAEDLRIALSHLGGVI